MPETKECRGCTGSCCTGQGNEPCTCEPVTDPSEQRLYSVTVDGEHYWFRAGHGASIEFADDGARFINAEFQCTECGGDMEGELRAIWRRQRGLPVKIHQGAQP